MCTFPNQNVTLYPLQLVIWIFRNMSLDITMCRPTIVYIFKCEGVTVKGFSDYMCTCEHKCLCAHV